MSAEGMFQMLVFSERERERETDRDKERQGGREKEDWGSKSLSGALDKQPRFL